MKHNKNLILIELNEINFDVVEWYTSKYKGRFQFLENLLSLHRIKTTSESNYFCLEPWIQWVSVHTGLCFDEHKVFRLGDIVTTTQPQIFEVVEARGYKVGSISAMNAANRLSNPAYFIPDPWTKTEPSKNWWDKSLSSAISQAVNDNSQSKITLSSLIVLFLGLLRFSRVKNYLQYLKLFSTCRKASWRKALFLDLLIHDIHLAFLSRSEPNFSTVFFNAGAHIQHHYLLAAEPFIGNRPRQNPDWYLKPDEDPFYDMLEVYDQIIGQYLGSSKYEIVFATGLTQLPYTSVEYYYRLKNHALFLTEIGIKYKFIFPRMTRDFLIEFNCKDEVAIVKAELETIRMKNDGQNVFGDFEIRETSLFVSLIYPNQITADSEIVFGHRSILFQSFVAFVALKNGMHQPEGFAFFSAGVERYSPENGSHVKNLFRTVDEYFR